MIYNESGEIMGENSRMIINQIAEKLREILGIDSDSFDIENIVESLGGKIVSDSFSLEEATVRKSDENGFEIILGIFCVNERRQRFSIAHELGHLFLHMKYKISDEWDNVPIGSKYNRNTNISYCNLEREANEFAAAFLMPKDRFLEVAEETSDKKRYYPWKIADIFNVSEQAVEVRGRILGIWE